VTGTVRIATRSSAQATAQATAIGRQLTARARDTGTQLHVELVFVDTLGDRRTDVPLHSIGGQGVFVKEVQHAVRRGDADLAVHSAKDLPSQPTDGLVIAAFAARRSAHDALIGSSLDGLADGATVATGSVRRAAQLRAVRPDLRFAELRGNIHTRLAKLPEDGALVMAVAALEILEITDRIAEVLPVDRFVPSPGQGAVAVEAREDTTSIEIASLVDHPPTRAEVEAERAFLATLGSGCSLPVGAHVDRRNVLHGFIAGPDHRQSITRHEPLPDDSTQWVARAAAMARGMASELDQLVDQQGS
jgi:hydroxymethylbilane synthase